MQGNTAGMGQENGFWGERQQMCIRDRYYLTPDRTKPITARKLGDDFDRDAVFAVLEQNAARATEQSLLSLIHI